MKQEEFRFITVITCSDNNPLLFFPCGGRPMLLAFSGFICIFVSPLFLLMNYLLQSEMTAEITDDCCRGWMGAFLLFVIIPFFPDFQSSFSLMFPNDNRREAKKKTPYILTLLVEPFYCLAGTQLPLLL